MTDHRCNIMVSIDCNEGFYDTSPVHYRSILIIDGVAARLCDETTPFCVKPTLSYLMEAKIMRAKYTINLQLRHQRTWRPVNTGESSSSVIMEATCSRYVAASARISSIRRHNWVRRADGRCKNERNIRMLPSISAAKDNICAEINERTEAKKEKTKANKRKGAFKGNK